MHWSSRCTGGYNYDASLSAYHALIMEEICLMFHRELSASLFMYLLVKQRGLSVHIEKRDYGRICLLGVFSFINVVGTVLALQYINPVRYAG